MTGITQEEYNKGGYAKHKLTKEQIDRVHSRAIDSKGKVYQGEAGKALTARKSAKQAYYDRNRK